MLISFRNLLKIVRFSIFVLVISCAQQEPENTATAPVCGNAKVEASEDCDDGNTIDDGNGCSETCQNNSVCGDGIRQSIFEVCDSGGLFTAACNDNCTLPRCGDGLLNLAAGEQCDDSNRTNNDGCSSQCKIEFCGDGIRQTQEHCDDGSNNNGDGCNATCQVEEDAQEPANNSLGGAFVLNANAVLSARHSIHTNSDVDFFSVTPASTDVFTWFQVVSDECIYDDSRQLFLELLAPNGSTVLSSGGERGLGSVTCAGFSRQLTSLDTHFLRVTGIGTAPFFANYFVYAKTLFPDAEEPDNTYEQATPLAVNGAALTGRSLHVGNDVDFYSFAVTDTQVTYTVAIANAACVAGDMRTLQLTIYGMNGTSVLSQAEDGSLEGQRVCPRIQRTFNSVGTYFFRVSSYEQGDVNRGVFDSYDIRVTSP